MKVLLDPGVPKKLARSLREHDVITALDAGWASMENGVLLALIEQGGFQVFVTADKNIEYQQSHLDRKPFGMLVLSTKHWPSMEPYVAKVVEAVGRCAPGTILEIECGKFVPLRFRR